MSDRIASPKVYMGDTETLIEVGNPYSVTLTGNIFVSTDNLEYEIPLVDLSNYAQVNITDYQNINSLPQENITYLSKVKPTNMTAAFYQCSNIKNLDLSFIDTSEVISLSNIFGFCTSLVSVNLSNWDTSKVTNMDSMFYECNAVTDIDLSMFNTSKVTSLGNTFTNCTSLTSVNLSNWDTSKVTNMSAIFYNCTNLTTVTGVIDMSSCIDCRNMFALCSNLRGVHLKNVPRALDLSATAGVEGETYIIDSYLENEDTHWYVEFFSCGLPSDPGHSTGKAWFPKSNSENYLTEDIIKQIDSFYYMFMSAKLQNLSTSEFVASSTFGNIAPFLLVNINANFELKLYYTAT